MVKQVQQESPDEIKRRINDNLNRLKKLTGAIAQSYRDGFVSEDTFHLYITQIQKEMRESIDEYNQLMDRMGFDY